MTRPQLVVVHAANALVAITGLVYAWMRYLVEPADEWAVVNHPWQPHVQHLHVIFAPLLVFAVGLIWSGHVAAKLRNGRRNRVLGLGLTAVFIPMVASGYLLQTAVDARWRELWVWLHLGASLLWIVALTAHQIRAVTSQVEVQSGIERSASVINESNDSPSSSKPPSAAGGGRQRSVMTGSGIRAPSRADATSDGSGGLAE